MYRAYLEVQAKAKADTEERLRDCFRAERSSYACASIRREFVAAVFRVMECALYPYKVVVPNREIDTRSWHYYKCVLGSWVK